MIVGILRKPHLSAVLWNFNNVVRNLCYKKENKTPVQRMDNQSEAQEIQYSIYKKMTADEKIRLATNLYSTARKIKRAELQNKYPQLTEAEIDKKLRDIFLHART